MQDEPLTIFGGLRALDGLIAFVAFFGSNLLMQSVTTLRYLVVFLSAVAMGVSVYVVILAIRRVGPDGFHWSFLHWFGVLPMRGAVPSRGIEHEPF
jgi:hypothetical protein